MTSASNSKDFRVKPNVIPWPPILLVATIVAGSLLGRLFPTLAGVQTIGYFVLTPTQVWLGWLLILLAITVDIWVFSVFRRHKTNIRPDRPAECLVTSGPFSYSRNPVYVGNIAIIVGLSLINGSAWYLLLAALMFVLIRELAVKREEAHMSARFGDQWASYRTQVRRWF